MMRFFTTILKIISGVILLWLLGLALYTASIFVTRPQSPDTTTDAIVVFTGHGDRIETGLELFAQNRSKYLFISGVHRDATQHDILAKARIDKNTIPACCLMLGHEALDTIGNANETREFLLSNNIETLRLVTSNFHIPRALLELHHAAPDVKVLVHPIIHEDMYYKQEYFWILIVKEYHKTLYRGLSFIFTPDESNEKK